MKHVVFENDEKISSYLKRYLENKEHFIVYNADQAGVDKIMESLELAEVLVFQPTQITWGQYNHILMVIYKLLKENKTPLKEIHIFNHSHDVEDELRELWGDKRQYLDVVLSKIKLFDVDNETKKEIHI